MINAKYASWKKKSLTDRGWKDSKKYFRTALKDMSKITRLTTGEPGLTANSAIKKDNTEDKIHVEIVEKFGKSFDTLTLAATVKSDTIDALVESISDPKKANIAPYEGQRRSCRHQQEVDHQARVNEGPPQPTQQSVQRQHQDNQKQ